MAQYNLPRMYWKCKRCSILKNRNIYVSCFGDNVNESCPDCRYVPTKEQLRGNIHHSPLSFKRWAEKSQPVLERINGISG